MEIVVHNKNSVSTKVSKEIVPFQKEFPTLESDVKMIQLDFRVGQKNPTPTPSVVRNPTPTKNLGLVASPTPQPWFFGTSSNHFAPPKISPGCGLLIITETRTIKRILMNLLIPIECKHAEQSSSPRLRWIHLKIQQSSQRHNQEMLWAGRSIYECNSSISYTSASLLHARTKNAELPLGTTMSANCTVGSMKSSKAGLTNVWYWWRTPCHYNSKKQC